MRSEKGNLYLVNPLGQGSEPLPIPRCQVQIKVGGYVLQGISRTYSDGPSDEPLALVGSSGHLEIALVGGSAAQALDLRVGDSVIVDTDIR
jgi:S-adenosylmethionine hydrolase